MLLRCSRILTATGLAALVFLAYEFLLTGLAQQHRQHALLEQFRQELPTTTLDAPGSVAAEGNPVALIQIPSLGLDQVVVEGTSAEDLRSGPGHLRSQPLPGEFGNSVIAAHRLSYGGPFRNLERLGPRDTINITTGQGSFVYTVTEVHSVHPGDPDLVGASRDSRLTLVTSDPPFIASGRLAVVAKLRGLPASLPSRPPVRTAPAELGLAGDTLGLGLALIWGQLLAGAIWLARRQTRRWPRSVNFMLAGPVILGLGVLASAGLDRLLPATL